MDNKFVARDGLQINGMVLGTDTDKLLVAGADGIVKNIDRSSLNFYTQNQTNNFFSGTTTISGYNKSDWDSAADWVTNFNINDHTHTHNYLSIEGGTLNGDLFFRDDNEGVNLYQGAKVYKKSGSGLTLRRHSGEIDPRVENNAGTSSWKIFHEGNLTNLSQLNNDSGFITGFSETDTLDSVTNRGATTTNPITIGGLTVNDGNLEVNATQTEITKFGKYYNSLNVHGDTILRTQSHYWNGSSYSNDGYSVGLGKFALYRNKGYWSYGIGRYALGDNIGEKSIGIGNLAASNNAGDDVIAIGGNTFEYNTGRNSVGVGRVNGRWNDGRNVVAIGYNNINTFEEDTAKGKTFLPTDVNVTLNRVTITTHGFGSNGDIKNLIYYNVSGDGIGVNDWAIEQWKIIDANTLELVPDYYGNLISGTGEHKLVPQFVYDDVVLIGSNLNPNRANQTLLGGLSIAAPEATNAEIDSVGPKALITKEYLDNQISGIDETDTLDSVTGRGSTTTNDVTVGGLTVTGFVNASGIHSIENGTGVQYGEIIKVSNPKGGRAYFGSGEQIGAIKIILPLNAPSDDMIRMTVDIYNYSTDTSMTLFMGGYTHPTSNWTQTFSQIISSKGNLDYNIRFGYSDNRRCIWIGEVDTSWSYPAISISNLQVSFAPQINTLWVEGWSISLSTTFDTVNKTHNNNFPYGDFNKLKNIPTVFPIDDSNLVHKTGNEDIGGSKSFTSPIAVKNGAEQSVFDSTGVTFNRGTSYLKPIDNGNKSLYIGGFSKGQNDWANINIYGTGLFRYNNSDIYHSGNFTPGNYVLKSGDTMSGTLNVPNIGLSNDGAIFLKGSTDPTHKIYNDIEDNEVVEYSKGFKLKYYNNGSPVDRLTVNSSGNATFSGSVTGTSFIKSSSSDSFMLLGGGGTKALSDFASAHVTNEGHSFTWSGISIDVPKYIGTVQVFNNGSAGGFAYTIVTQGGLMGTGVVQVSAMGTTAAAYLKVISSCTDGHQILAKLRVDTTYIDFYLNPKTAKSYTPRVYCVNYGGYSSNIEPVLPTTWDYTFSLDVLESTKLTSDSVTTMRGGASGDGGVHLKSEGWLNLYSFDNTKRIRLNTSSTLNRLDIYNQTDNTFADIKVKNIEGGAINATSYSRIGSSDSYMLLGGGGTKALSDFSLSNHTHSYLPLSGGTLTGSLSFTPGGAGTAIASVFGTNTTNKSYINFNAVTGSSDPGYIVHETSASVTNNGVIHISPSDDNSRGDYVSIHGTNDPESIKLHTDGYIETTGRVYAESFQKLGSSDSYILLGAGGTKALNEVVQTTGDQSISGIKTFTSELRAHGRIVAPYFRIRGDGDLTKHAEFFYDTSNNTIKLYPLINNGADSTINTGFQLFYGGNYRTIYHSGNFTPGNYVSKSGDDMTGPLVISDVSTPGQTIFDVHGSAGQLFSITDSLEGDLFSVNDISGLPILTVNSDDLVTINGTTVSDTFIKSGSSDSEILLGGGGITDLYTKYGLGKTATYDTTDLNDRRVGEFIAFPGNTTNAPSNQAGSGIVFPFLSSDGVYKHTAQLATNYGEDSLFFRKTDSGGTAFGTWKKLWHSGNLTPGDYLKRDGTNSMSGQLDMHNNILLNGGKSIMLRGGSGSPTDTGDILFQDYSGLEIGRIWRDPAADRFLLRFSASDTTKELYHSGNFTPGNYVLKSGDTMSGDLIIGNKMTAWNSITPGLGRGNIHIGIDSSTSHSGGAITFKARDTGDGAVAGLYVISDGTYGSKMFLATTNSYGTGSKTAISIDHLQNTTFYNKIIKSGGTASQFLKADGSVDSTAYLSLTGGSISGTLKVKTIMSNTSDGISIYGENNDGTGRGANMYIGGNSDANVNFTIGDSNTDTTGVFSINNRSSTTQGAVTLTNIAGFTWNGDTIATQAWVNSQDFGSGGGTTIGDNLAAGIIPTGTGSGGTFSNFTYATDGNFSTTNYANFGSGSTGTTGTEGAYIQIDLGAVYDCLENRIWFYDQDNRHYWYKLKYSVDGINWSYAIGNASTFVQSNSTSEPDIINLGGTVQARYWRIYGNGNSSNTSNHLYEWEIYEGTGDAAPFNGGTITNALTIDTGVTDGTFLRFNHPTAPTDAGYEIGFSNNNLAISHKVEYSNAVAEAFNIDRQTRNVTFSANITAAKVYATAASGSLRSIKKNIHPYDKSALTIWRELDIHYFDYKDDSTLGMIGPMADDESTSKDILTEDNKAINLHNAIFVAGKAIQEMDEIIQNQNNKIQDLISRLETLEKIIKE